MIKVAFVRALPAARVKALPVALLKFVPLITRFDEVPLSVSTLPEAATKFEFVTFKPVRPDVLKVRTEPPAFVAVTFDKLTLEAVSPNVKAEPVECDAVTFVRVRLLTGP